MAVAIKVGSAPEEYGLISPDFWNKVRLSQQVIEDVGVQDRLMLEFLVKFVTPNDSTTLLLFG